MPGRLAKARYFNVAQTGGGAADVACRYLSRCSIFDFFDSGAASVQDLVIARDSETLRWVRHGSLLVVELAGDTGVAELRMQYAATLARTPMASTEFLLYEDWIPYLGGAANWSLDVALPLRQS